MAIGVLLEEVDRCKRLVPKITSALRSFIRWKKSAAIIGWLLIIIGIVGEGVFDGLVSTADALIEIFNTNLLVATEREAEFAEVQSASAIDRASKAESETEIIRRSNLLLKEKIADRYLSVSQRWVIRNALLKFPRQEWQIVTFSGDGEARGLSTDIESSLVGKDGAGWSVPNRSADETALPIQGILV